MKVRQFLGCAILLAALTFVSCGNENEVVNINVTEGSLTRVTFSIAIPKGDPVTYAIHDADEWGIESLWLYEYDGAGKLLAAPVNIKASLTGTGPAYSYEKNISAADAGVRRFVFVANEAPNAAITPGTQLTALQAVLASKTLADNASSKTLLNSINSQDRIPMTGVAEQNGSDLIAVNGATNAAVAMTRIVARIDVANKVPNFVITAMKLAKTNSKSNLFLKGDYEAATGNTKVNGITPFAAMPSPFDNGKNLPKAFYLYEGHQPSEAEAVRVEITGTLGGVPVHYSIPFWKNSKEVVVKRNHIYRLTIGDGNTVIEPNSNVQFTIEDTPWNLITMNEQWDIMTATHTGSGAFAGTGIERTLTLNSSAYTETFAFTTKFAGHTAFTAAIAGSPAPTWLTAAFSGSTLTLNVQANNAPGAVDREALVEITSNADAATKYKILVKQGK